MLRFNMVKANLLLTERQTSVKKNSFEYVVCEMLAIFLFRPLNALSSCEKKFILHSSWQTTYYIMQNSTLHVIENLDLKSFH